MAQEFDNISFPGWEVVRKLGEGSFGGVYEIQRAMLNGRVKSTLKKRIVPNGGTALQRGRHNHP